MSAGPNPRPPDDELGLSDDALEHLAQKFHAIPVDLGRALVSMPPISAREITLEIQRALAETSGPPDKACHQRILNLASESVAFYFDAIERRALPPKTIFTLVGELAHVSATEGGSPGLVHSAIQIGTKSAVTQLRDIAKASEIDNSQLDTALNALYTFTGFLSYQAKAQAQSPNPPSLSRPETLAALLGRNLRATREQLGMSQETLANQLGYTHTFMSDLERGVRIVSLESLEHIAAILEVEAADLLRE